MKQKNKKSNKIRKVISIFISLFRCIEEIAFSNLSINNVQKFAVPNLLRYKLENHMVPFMRFVVYLITNYLITKTLHITKL